MPGLGVGAWGNSVASEGGVIVNAGAPGPGSFVPSAPAEVYGSGGRSAPHLERENVVLADGFLARREESCAHVGS